MMHRIVLLVAMMALIASVAVAPALADHWNVYEDTEGECGWNWFFEYPFWVYDCHVEEEPVEALQFGNTANNENAP